MSDLQALRTRINEVDEALLALFVEREEICIQIGEVKRAQGKAILDTSREQEKIRGNVAYVEGKLAASNLTDAQKDCVRVGTENLTQQLMAEGRRIQGC